MAYEPYVSPEYYRGVYKGSKVPDEDLEKALRQASRHIDSLTFNRIAGQPECLSEKQKEIVQEFACKQADFEWENQDIFDMVLRGYSINGVSIQFGESWNVTVQKGIPVRRDDYDTLCQTGLCSRLLR